MRPLEQITTMAESLGMTAVGRWYCLETLTEALEQLIDPQLRTDNGVIA